jgi:hypothetical protein
MIPILIFLHGCGSGIATGNGLIFKELKDWSYLGRSERRLLETFKSEKRAELEIWSIDPRKFPVQTYRNLHYIDPTIDCPATGCPDPTSSTFQEYYRPFCNYAEACWRFLYIESGQGKYREIFSRPFWPLERSGARIPLRISEQQQQDGLPLCIELAGIDFLYQQENQLPDIDMSRNKFVFRYCYNGKTYEVNKVYSVPIKNK